AFVFVQIRQFASEEISLTTTSHQTRDFPSNVSSYAFGFEKYYHSPNVPFYPPNTGCYPEDGSKNKNPSKPA
ncbi:MAG TPA: hypothetical protein VFF11_00545, partial [Candidatus Binatia bacterium]|nr:hypothetical protein [Candidatus Binatia bacterium]